MTSTSVRPDAPTATARPAPRTGLLLAIILSGQFMALLDVSVVNVAIATIQADLGASGAGLQLIVAGYTITYAVLLVTGARLGDLAGPARMFQLGVVVFTLASLLCGLAVNTGMLVAFRFAQGAGSALMVPQVLSLIQRTFEGASRARALSWYAAVLSGGAIVGQILGGVLVEADVAGAGWRTAFLINVPVGVVLLLASARWLPVTGRVPGRRLDPLGVVTLSAAVLTFVVPLVFGHELGWPAWGWWSLAASGVLLGAFIVVESRVARRGGSPLIAGRLLRVHGFVPSVAALGLMFVAYGGCLFVAAVHVQRALGFGPLEAGLAFVPGGVGFALASLNWRRLPTGWHARLPVAGLSVTAASYLALALAFSGGRTGGLALYGSMLCFGLGQGATFSPLMHRALAAVPGRDAADASGLLQTWLQLAQVIGVAAFGTLFLSRAGDFEPGRSAGAFGLTGVVMAATIVVSVVLVLLDARRASRRANRLASQPGE